MLPLTPPDSETSPFQQTVAGQLRVAADFAPLRPEKRLNTAVRPLLGLAGGRVMRRTFPAVALVFAIGISLPACTPSADDSEIRALVEAFGSRLQGVSLTSPTANEAINAQYADFVDSSLLEEWARAPGAAPGRAVSSPWPDRIEIISLDQVSPGVYSITAEVVEITSYELTHGGEAGRFPVRISVRRLQGRWMITGWATQGE